MQKPISILFLLFHFLVSGQNLILSDKGRFGVEFNKGCYPFTVNIHIQDTFGDIERGYFYLPTDIDSSPDTTFSYNESGLFQIIQFISLDNVGSKFDTLNIEVIEPVQPRVDLERCSFNEILFSSNDTFYDYIRLYFPSGDSIQLSIGESFSRVVSGQNTYTSKGFFENANEVCTSYQVDFANENIGAPIINSASISEICSGSFYLELSLDQIDTLSSYEISLNQGSNTVLYSGKLQNGTFTFNDVPYDKFMLNYCIRLNQLNPCLGTGTQVSELCQAPTLLSLTPFENLFSSYTENAISINFDTIDAGIIEVYRSTDDINFELRTQTTNPISDPIGSSARMYYYRLDHIDSCGNVLSTQFTNPPLIDTDKLADNQYRVAYTPPNPIHPAISNSIFFISFEVGENLETSTQAFNGLAIDEQLEFDLSLNAKDGEIQRLKASIFNQQGLELQKSNTVLLKYELLIYVPQAFTPNDDRLNDTLDFYGLPSTSNATIYTRWGQTLWKKELEINENPVSTGWDGKVNDKVAPEGTYIYEITFSDAQGNLRRQKGSFVLIK